MYIYRVTKIFENVISNNKLRLGFLTQLLSNLIFESDTFTEPEAH